MGDTVKVTAPNVRAKPFTIVGLFSTQTGAVLTQISMGFMPIETAQAYFNNRRMGVPKNAIDKIQIVTSPNVKVEDEESALRLCFRKTSKSTVPRPARSSCRRRCSRPNRV